MCVGKCLWQKTRARLYTCIERKSVYVLGWPWWSLSLFHPEPLILFPLVLQRRPPDPKTQLNHDNEVRELENFYVLCNSCLWLASFFPLPLFDPSFSSLLVILLLFSFLSDFLRFKNQEKTSSVDDRMVWRVGNEAGRGGGSKNKWGSGGRRREKEKRWGRGWVGVLVSPGVAPGRNKRSFVCWSRGRCISRDSRTKHTVRGPFLQPSIFQPPPNSPFIIYVYKNYTYTCIC